ncbi:hypothetical protein EXT67_17030 [Pectobacterium atrosepticum]|nr:hypothetical protein CVS35_22580 [Pectobacterium atrosepticum]MCL6318010.1 hypothetical protein [Pectobacterium atrosepticum]MCL6322841.1 hypothetical protein [Pectobacterium atrosepticum]MCL6393008.1 hypothetical protein [Pectobacterium atrosepticum]PWD54924.1 hypothetical protein DF214_19320 [Pectobacterium atrosepticum]
MVLLLALLRMISGERSLFALGWGILLNFEPTTKSVGSSLIKERSFYLKISLLDLLLGSSFCVDK